MARRKKSGFFATIFLLVLGGIALMGVIVSLSPPSHHAATGVTVAVTPEPPPPKPDAPPTVAAMPAEPEGPAVGDEKTTAPEAEQPPSALPVPVPREPQQAEQPPSPADHPVIALVIDDMGLDIRDSARAVKLPAAVTLSYMPYASNLREQSYAAHEAGHELLLHMPMEPVGHDDPGPGALLVNLPPDKIRQRFQDALASFTGFDGVNNHMGSRFTADADGMGIVIDELSQRKLFFFDSRTSAKSVGASLARQHGLPTISRDVFLDDAIDEKSIMAQLAQTEKIARRRGFAVAIGHPHAVTLATLEMWLPTAEQRGITFVPLRQLVYPRSDP